ncbi:dephospho-CoA kinase [Fervidobacterium riparium]|uniref:Dephospho-CoA kinase n=1 Tax=Fervidobacterium gondwanense DSM 13020 TaxID=1121883 RepID=A0A1M7T6U7_FERGO|nr:dephospho-CoA kinase [Fervidobacterium gondwanense]UXF01818.1 dephospho-CoA kinase [Fervidobacterium riparium]SHN66424.1 dephospho-CoA kinase [Fervidobacterium gondwanense DSM 13020]
MTICVTGKIATGKSTVSKFFVGKGFEYINVDELGHKAFEINKEVIKKTFGTDDRKEVGKIVFASEEKLRQLEQIVHPTMLKLLDKRLEELKGKDIVIEAAIKRRLGIKNCDLTITVVASPETIRERLSGRYDEKTIEEILKRQEDIVEEGIVVENNSKIEELQERLEKIYEKYVNK